MIKRLIAGAVILFSFFHLYAQQDSLIDVNGICYIDANANDTLDAGESPLHFIFVQSGSCDTPEVTCIYGNYYQQLCDTSDTLYVLMPEWATWYTVSPSSHYVWQDSMYVNFGFVLNPAAQDLQVTGAGVSPQPRTGYDSFLHVNYRNIANTASNPVLTVTLDSRVDYLSASPFPDLVQGQLLTWNLSSLDPLETGTVHIRFHVPAGVLTGTDLHFESVIDPIAGDWAPADNQTSIDVQVTDSIGTFIKSVDRDTIISIDSIPGSPWLNYTVRFRNTGATEIVNIRIDDTLSSNLLFYTAGITGSSHRCNAQITATGVLNIYFSDVYLAAPADDEAASHGFVSFKIRTRNDLVQGDSILNTAYIIADFNEAAASNSTLNIVDQTTPSSMRNALSLSVYPNPATDFLQVDGLTDCYYSITSTTGQILLAGQTENGRISLGKISGGLYVLVISDQTSVRRTLFVKE